MTQTNSSINLTRRRFLRGSATIGGGLCIGFTLGGCTSDSKTNTPGPGPDVPAVDFEANAFVTIGSDNSVTIIAKHIEFGQGSFTGLATILADELGADWSQVKVEHAPSDAERYNNLFFGEIPGVGKVIGTGGSTAMANSWMQMRQAGATARAMLITAAATQWNVPENTISVAEGTVRHASSDRSVTFGELTTVAATLPIPENAPLKDPSEFTLIGRRNLKRVDIDGKLDGTAQYTMDIYQEDMLTAVIARSPRFGGTVASVNDTAARAVPGVVDVVQIPTGVAVIANKFWAARMGREALEIEWNDAEAETRSTDEIFTAYRELAAQPGLEARNDGDAANAIDGAATTIETEYLFPYLAHAPMEPLDCVMRFDGTTCEIWAGAQMCTAEQLFVSQILGIAPTDVNVHVQLAGGSFGRRATAVADMTSETAHIIRVLGTNRPVKLIWTREDDIKGGMYRPMFLHRVRAGLDAEGQFVGWHDRIVGQSANAPFVPPGVPNTTTTEGAHLPYAVANNLIDVHVTASPVSVLWWRSVEHTHNAFVVETMIDELAEAAGQDALEFRRSLLASHPRHLGVLNLAAERANWGSPLPAGRARGIAVQESFGSYVAQVAEVSVGADGRPVVHRVVVGVDCGIVINPDNVCAQIEGGLGFGLAAALHNEITLDAGRVMQSNFHDYRLFRIHEMPEIEVHLVASGEAPSGAGEIATPVIAPAVANAMRRLTGTPVRRLPFQPTTQV